ncbi:2-oxo-4-hydroxy-4-carboxy-5-ureidoimidazoline decarboxylase [Chitinophaga rupis]|uniref:2-oxo-4-hydroxy-4-carboxy-5-ureidoimidazoline decarboxylase n=1 Tax=Chitinophaga rupis TaxID=573321 RepID=A0A1H8CIA8_9BACT|nr:2-oxo-4-hydroxy-4-carboxy-5-ureidoimidazoline decarboxylase [Chitinophaga rupis]SEM94008.1 2-oxo-4-hydroxy-4-carboxy-5-ureidoimidazoline decarboxylase [Chitinophaga rupis]
MTIEALNKLAPAALKETLFQCCGSATWVERMSRRFPFQDEAALYQAAAEVWESCTTGDWKEAFSHHPMIGDLEDLQKKFAGTAQWAANEQAAVQHAANVTLLLLAEGNRAYLQKFGYIFIVCATGKSAAEMLQLLEERLSNTPETEIKIAMAEQGKITRIRLQKLLAV